MTVTYFDTSALVPLVISEPSTNLCQQVWVRSERRVSSVVAKAELAAALAKAHRLGRIGRPERQDALDAAWRIFAACDLITVNDALAESAARQALRRQLRGYDAVHVASSLLVADDVVCASGDRAMLAAWRDLGLATADLTATRAT